MKNENLYYKESGAVGLIGIVLISVVGLVLSGILGIIYGFAILFIPFIYLNFFITLAYGGAIGYSLGKIGYFTKIRNYTVIVIFGVLFGFVAEYFGWVFWIQAFRDSGAPDFSIFEVFEDMGRIANRGAWSIFGITPTGIALYIIWIIEAIMIIGAAVVFAITGFGSKPFCERCNSWTDEINLKSTLNGTSNPIKLVTELENKNFDSLIQLASKESVFRQTRVTLSTCKKCNNEYYLTLNDVKVTINDKGKAEESEDTIVENLIINKQEFEEIKNLDKIERKKEIKKGKEEEKS